MRAPVVVTKSLAIYAVCKRIILHDKKKER